MSNLKIFDISPEISPETAVFPGDTKFSRAEALSTKNGDHLTLSSINTTVHIGAHTDAPNHYHRNGCDMASRDLDFYIGECQVLEVNIAPNNRIKPEDIREEISSTRILFKTNSYPNPKRWNNDFNAISSELVEYLAKKDVKLIGIDTPSVDLANDKELEAHLSIYKNNMAILEGIILKDIVPQKYKLIALPLKIKNADASPVRAVLILGDL
tara:strand:+ start:93 stop:728 length:636 start_codon:yes stop_codon:yes gene_type:complete